VEFPETNKREFNSLLKKIRETESTDRRHGRTGLAGVADRNSRVLTIVDELF